MKAWSSSGTLGRGAHIIEEGESAEFGDQLDALS